MRVALITEGAYPYHAGGASGWCHQLVRGQPRHAYQLVALTSEPTGDTPAYSVPPNVDTLTPVPVWGRPTVPTGRIARLRSRRAATSAAVLLCRGLLGDGPHHATMFRDALVRLAQLSADGSHPLHGTPLADVLLDAWRAARAGTTGDGDGGDRSGDFRVPLPRLSVRDAESAAVLLEHALRPLAVTVPGADLCHAASGGLPLLVALAARWRTGTPYLLTEHGIYLRERYLDYGETLPEAVKAVMLRFFRALSRLGYAEATLIVAASRFNQRWQLRHGAHPAKVLVIPGGVDPDEFARCPDEPADPVVVWTGPLAPVHDLPTLIRAIRRLRDDLPAVRLLLVDSDGGAGDEYAAECRTLVERLGISGAVQFAGPASGTADTYAAGQVAALPQLSEGVPYQVMEAMMCGRATVSTEVGGAAEVVGDAGVTVPPGDPVALAEALRALLADSGRRRTLGEAAHRRAYSQFRLDHLVRAYDQLYADAVETSQVAAAPAGAVR